MKKGPEILLVLVAAGVVAGSVALVVHHRRSKKKDDRKEDGKRGSGRHPKKRRPLSIGERIGAMAMGVPPAFVFGGGPEVIAGSKIVEGAEGVVEGVQDELDKIF